jgi:hypothetical protein
MTLAAPACRPNRQLQKICKIANLVQNSMLYFPKFIPTTQVKGQFDREISKHVILRLFKKRVKFRGNKIFHEISSSPSRRDIN